MLYENLARIVAVVRLAAERVTLAREREALARQVQALQSGVQSAARAAVAEGLAGAAVEWVAAAMVLFGWLVSSGVLWWNTAAIGAAQTRKAEL